MLVVLIFIIWWQNLFQVTGMLRTACCRLLSSSAKLTVQVPKTKFNFIAPKPLFYSSPRLYSKMAEELASEDPMKKRAAKKRKCFSDAQDRPGYWNLVAYSTAEEYDLPEMECTFCKNEMIQVTSLGNELPHSDFFHAVVKGDGSGCNEESREVFVFREGTIVTWNVRDIDIEVLLGLASKHQIGAYSDDIVREECEVINYRYATTNEKTSIKDDDITLVKSDEAKFHKFAISNATALSVKLGAWEATLAKYIDTMAPVTEDMKSGKKIRMSQNEVMKRTGELFALRHAINLSSDLLDTPDVYWDNEQLGNIYQQFISYFCINKRTRVINLKLNHCVELVELLSAHLRDNHHIRLEWMIIILIMIEVMFELIHHLEKPAKESPKSEQKKGWFGNDHSRTRGAA